MQLEMLVVVPFSPNPVCEDGSKDEALALRAD